MDELVDVRCPNCRKMLFRCAASTGVIETKCNRCGAIVRYPAQKAEIVEPPKPRRVFPKEVISE